MERKFREELESFLEDRPVETPCGLVVEETTTGHFGYRGGDHDPVVMWSYRRDGTEVEMQFGFYSNFTENDLICKIAEIGSEFSPGEGATIQFNAGRSIYEDEDGDLAFQHEGRFTAFGRGLKRSDMLAAVWSAIPDLVPELGVLGWPYLIGTSNDFDVLLDSLFLYAYAIEQGKRRIRGQSPLPVFTVPEDSD